MISKGRKATSKKAPERPFDHALWRRSQRIAASYRVILEREKSGFRASSLEMPSVVVHARTADQCERSARQALAVAVAAMLELARSPPTTAHRRSAQVNIRLTPAEKFRLEESARRAGFRGLSDYIRHASLQAARKPT